MRNALRHRIFRFMIAHVLACYLVAGISVLLYAKGAEAHRAASAPAMAEDGDEDEGDPWYLDGRLIVAAAPLSVPILLGLVALLSVYSPVERPPLYAFPLLLMFYAIPLALIYVALGFLRPSVARAPEPPRIPAE